MIRKSEQAGPSEVEVAGGYVLDKIRTANEASAAVRGFDHLMAQVHAAKEDMVEKLDAREEAKRRLDAYIDNAIEA